MFNLVVDNLEEALSQVAAGGAQVVGDIEKSEYGNINSLSHLSWLVLIVSSN